MTWVDKARQKFDSIGSLISYENSDPVKGEIIFAIHTKDTSHIEAYRVNENKWYQIKVDFFGYGGSQQSYSAKMNPNMLLIVFKA